MTYTITIDQPIKLEKTHFFDDTELMYYIAKSKLKSGKDISITSKPKNRKTQYQKAMEDFKKGENIISMPNNIQTVDQFVQFIKQST